MFISFNKSEIGGRDVIITMVRLVTISMTCTRFGLHGCLIEIELGIINCRF